MPCYGPLTAYLPNENSGGKLVFRKDKSATGIPIKIPCGKCIGCKLEHSRQWAVRCMHEKRMHAQSAFLTLTYSDKNLPPGKTLVKSDLQNFMKRLRHVTGPGLRFFACGEYGEKTLRPHYHVLLLSHTLPDLSVFSRGPDYNLYTSKTLSTLWTVGNSVIGDVTFDSAAYVARYCVKKITGPGAADHYGNRTPEFLLMSRRPGIGTTYVQRHRSEILAHDNIIINGVPSSLPRFYDNKISDTDYNLQNIGCETPLERLKRLRRRKLQRGDNSQRRLRTKELVTIAKLNLKGKSL